VRHTELGEQANRVPADVLVHLLLAQQAKVIQSEQAVLPERVLLLEVRVLLHEVVPQRIWQPTTSCYIPTCIPHLL